VEHHQYAISKGALAYWPPGYPFFLSPWLFVLGFKNWVPILANMVLFAASLLVVERLARRIGQGVACLAVLLFAFWPNLIMTAGMASKEMLVLFLICSALLIYSDSQDQTLSTSGVLLALSAGILVGFASLTQPSMMLFPSVLAASEWIRRERWNHALPRLVLSVLALFLAILPWTIRNHRVLHTWTPISTNGGEVFYRANNPLATGGYTPVGEHDLSNLGEVEQGKVGFHLGTEWIREHPGQFLALGIRKQVLFLGDDAQGAFETLKRGLNIGGAQYIAWKGIANLYWWLVWTVILLMLAIHRRTSISQNPILVSTMVGVLYLYSIHSVFESGAKYHEPLIGFLAVIAGAMFGNQSAAE